MRANRGWFLGWGMRRWSGIGDLIQNLLRERGDGRDGDEMELVNCCFSNWKCFFFQLLLSILRIQIYLPLASTC